MNTITEVDALIDAFIESNLGDESHHMDKRWIQNSNSSDSEIIEETNDDDTITTGSLDKLLEIIEFYKSETQNESLETTYLQLLDRTMNILAYQLIRGKEISPYLEPLMELAIAFKAKSIENEDLESLIGNILLRYNKDMKQVKVKDKKTWVHYCAQFHVATPILLSYTSKLFPNSNLHLDIVSLSLYSEIHRRFGFQYAAKYLSDINLLDCEMKYVKLFAKLGCGEMIVELQHWNSRKLNSNMVFLSSLIVAAALDSLVNLDEDANIPFDDILFLKQQFELVVDASFDFIDEILVDLDSTATSSFTASSDLLESLVCVCKPLCIWMKHNEFSLKYYEGMFNIVQISKFFYSEIDASKDLIIITELMKEALFCLITLKCARNKMSRLFYDLAEFCINNGNTEVRNIVFGLLSEVCQNDLCEVCKKYEQNRTSLLKNDT